MGHCREDSVRGALYSQSMMYGHSHIEGVGLRVRDEGTVSVPHLMRGWRIGATSSCWHWYTSIGRSCEGGGQVEYMSVLLHSLTSGPHGGVQHVGAIGGRRVGSRGEWGYIPMRTMGAWLSPRLLGGLLGTR